MKVRQSEAGCWEWRGSLNRNGYGQFYLTAAPSQAHRVAWMLTRGGIPSGLFVCHHCDNKKCVRPSHLFLGTAKDNMADALKKGRMSVAHPKRQRVTDAQLAEMVEMRLAGVQVKRISEQFGVSRGYVSMVTRGKRRQFSEPVKAATHAA